ncbi:MAG: hypothetical protein JW726_16540 [Anaerolineales bacterium]|nr:hypothetical protein [Anaerolineales bacterium]
MRIVLDTNVFVSGVFFSGPPYQILAQDHPGIDLKPVLDFVIRQAEIYAAPSLPEAVCEDPDDDKFLACALASEIRLIVSGDKHLLKVSGYQEIEILSARGSYKSTGINLGPQWWARRRKRTIDHVNTPSGSGLVRRVFDLDDQTHLFFSDNELLHSSWPQPPPQQRDIGITSLGDQSAKDQAWRVIKENGPIQTWHSLFIL